MFEGLGGLVFLGAIGYIIYLNDELASLKRGYEALSQDKKETDEMMKAHIAAKDEALHEIAEFLLMEEIFDDDNTVAELNARRKEVYRKGVAAYEIGRPVQQEQPKVECYEGTDVPIPRNSFSGAEAEKQLTRRHFARAPTNHS